MAVAPLGPLSLPLDNLKSLLSLSGNLQAVVTTQNAPQTSAEYQAVIAAAALSPTTYQAATAAKIFKFYTEEAYADQASPRVILGTLNEEAYVRRSSTGWKRVGPLLGSFEFAVPAALQGYEGWQQDAGVDFTNKIGLLLTDLENLLLSGGCLNLTEVRVLQCGQADPDDNNGAIYWGAELQFDWEGS